jgi:hypothetical protein
LRIVLDDQDAHGEMPVTRIEVTANPVSCLAMK